jgi:CRP/FNR family transcriptional regulator, anaerobic regulatory protein
VERQVLNRSHERVRSSEYRKPNGNSRQTTGVRRHRDVEQHWVDGTLRDFEAKGHVFSVGDAKTHVYKVSSGAVCLYTFLTDGRRQIIEFAFEGDVIGLGSASAQACNAQAVISTRLQCLPIAALLRAARQDAEIALRLYEEISRELVATREHLLCVGQRGACERLATFLLVLSRRNEARGDDPEMINLPMTRIDIADFLGLTLETVSRTFSKMKRQGLFEIDQTTTIRLKDAGKLVRLADGGARL